jgi:hypothetical protein
MRKHLLAGLATLTVLLVSLPGHVVAAAPRATGRAAVRAFRDAEHARMVWRGLHPAPAIPASDNRARTPLAFGTKRFVQQVSEDTLAPASGTEPDTQVEPDIDMDPNNALNVVAVVQQGRDPNGGSVDPGWASSPDGGKTWTSGNLPHLTTAVGGVWDRASDPAVAFGPDGAAYAVTLAFNTHNSLSGVAVNRSDDGGLTWNDPVMAATDPNGGDDKEWIAVDDFPSSPNFGRVYVAWDRAESFGQPILLVSSDTRGSSWSAVKTVSGANSFTIGARPVVQPNGDLTIVYENFASGKIVSQTSHDGGATFDAAVSVAADRASDPPDMRAGSDLPSAAVDPATGSMYVAWGDTRFRSDGTMDAVVSRSTDGGATWGAPVRANQDATTDGLDHVTPAVAANGGFVHVTYRTRAKTSNGYAKSVDMRYIVSGDSGQTFGGELVLGPLTNLRWAATAGGLFLGDYMGVAASAGSVHAVWCRASRPLTPETYHQTTWSVTIQK